MKRALDRRNTGDFELVQSHSGSAKKRARREPKAEDGQDGTASSRPPLNESPRFRVLCDSPPSAPVKFSTNLDSYKLLEVVGSGTYGAVYRAVEISTGRLVAVKVCHLTLGEAYYKSDATNAELGLDSIPEGLPVTALREIALLTAAKSLPHMVQLHEVVLQLSLKRVCLVMDHVPLDLRKFIVAAKESIEVQRRRYEGKVLEQWKQSAEAAAIVSDSLAGRDLLVSPPKARAGAGKQLMKPAEFVLLPAPARAQWRLEDRQDQILESKEHNEQLNSVHPKRLDSRLLRLLSYQLLRGIAALHERGIMHRDIKPENLLVASVPAPAPLQQTQQPRTPSATASNAASPDGLGNFATPVPTMGSRTAALNTTSGTAVTAATGVTDGTAKATTVTTAMSTKTASSLLNPSSSSSSDVLASAPRRAPHSGTEDSEGALSPHLNTGTKEQAAGEKEEQAEEQEKAEQQRFQEVLDLRIADFGLARVVNVTPYKPHMHAATATATATATSTAGGSSSSASASGEGATVAMGAYQHREFMRLQKHQQRHGHRPVDAEAFLRSRATYARGGMGTGGTGRQLTSNVVSLWYRAPEIMLGLADYGLPSDVFSAGCVIAEMAGLRPLFDSESEVGMLIKVFRSRGTPSLAQWPEMADFQHYNPLFPKFPSGRPLDLVHPQLKGLDPLCLDLLEHMLRVHPDHRCTASQALFHPYFRPNGTVVGPSRSVRTGASLSHDGEHDGDGDGDGHDNNDEEDMDGGDAARGQRRKGGNWRPKKSNRKASSDGEHTDGTEPAGRTGAPSEGVYGSGSGSGGAMDAVVDGAALLPATVMQQPAAPSQELPPRACHRIIRAVLNKHATAQPTGQPAAQSAAQPAALPPPVPPPCNPTLDIDTRDETDLLLGVDCSQHMNQSQGQLLDATAFLAAPLAADATLTSLFSSNSGAGSNLDISMGSHHVPAQSAPAALALPLHDPISLAAGLPPYLPAPFLPAMAGAMPSHLQLPGSDYARAFMMGFQAVAAATMYQQLQHQMQQHQQVPQLQPFWGAKLAVPGSSPVQPVAPDMSMAHAGASSCFKGDAGAASCGAAAAAGSVGASAMARMEL